MLGYATTSLCQKPSFIEEIWVRVSYHQNPLTIPISLWEDVFVCQEHIGWTLSWPLGKSSPELPKELWETVGKPSPSSLWPLSDSDQEPLVADTVGMKLSFRATHQLLPTDNSIPVLHPHPTYNHWPAFSGFAASITSELPSK